MSGRRKPKKRYPGEGRGIIQNNYAQVSEFYVKVDSIFNIVLAWHLPGLTLKPALQITANNLNFFFLRVRCKKLWGVGGLQNLISFLCMSHHWPKADHTQRNVGWTRQFQQDQVTLLCVWWPPNSPDIGERGLRQLHFNCPILLFLGR